MMPVKMSKQMTRRKTKPGWFFVVFLLTYSKQICQKQNREEGKLQETKEGRFGALV